jgi:zinc dependent phospholipase C
MVAASRRILIWSLALVLLAGAPAHAYSVLAHEATIDVAWPALRAVLLQRFPRTTADALKEARAYAYGGSVIQDLGYYPFGNRFFSNLLHYTRSGDFVEALIHDARDANELAFALGALAHYVTDNTGHPEAVNRSVPLLFPKLAKKFGHEITYVEAPRQHIVVEFSFDTVEVAKGTYEPEGYRNFIGFQVAKRVLEQAFRDTYGLEMKDQFASEDRAIATYRYAVSQIIPALTQAAWRDRHDEIATLQPNADRAKFIFQYRRQEFEREYGRDYQKPGLFARFLATAYRVLPKIGPLRKLTFKTPTPEAQALFEQSFRDAGAKYRTALAKVGSGRPDFVNTDFDTGRPAQHGEYALADETYAQLLQKLEERKFAGVSVALRRDVLAFYGRQPRPSTTSKSDAKHWDRVEVALIELARSR